MGLVIFNCSLHLQSPLTLVPARNDTTPELTLPVEIPESWYDLSVSDLASAIKSGKEEEGFKPKSIRKKELGKYSKLAILTYSREEI